MTRLLICLLATVTLTACTSTSGSDSGSKGDGSNDSNFVGPPTRITWTHYSSDRQISLSNETHTDRLEFYSRKRDTASVKIQEDELVAALIDFFDDEGFDDYSQIGSAPPQAVGSATQAFEVELDGRTSFMLWGPDQSSKERECFVQCRDGLTEIWNATFAAQSVKNERGGAVFGTSTGKKR